MLERLIRRAGIGRDPDCGGCLLTTGRPRCAAMARRQQAQRLLSTLKTAQPVGRRRVCDNSEGSSLMTLKLDIPHETEAGLLAQAHARGLSLEGSEEHTSELQSPCNLV